MSEQPTKRVSDYATDQQSFDGDKVDVGDLVGREFTIVRIVELSSEDGPYLGVQIQGSRGPYFFFTSHMVVSRKLRQCIGKEPLLATIRKRDPANGGHWFYDIE